MAGEFLSEDELEKLVENLYQYGKSTGYSVATFVGAMKILVELIEAENGPVSTKRHEVEDEVH